MKKTPHEEAMERLALRISLANQLDSAMPATPPPVGDDEDEHDQPAKR
jgi:hypothetical protein